jgi:hypothetical protein
MALHPRRQNFSRHWKFVIAHFKVLSEMCVGTEWNRAKSRRSKPGLYLNTCFSLILSLSLDPESYITTDGLSVSLSWNKAPIWGIRPDFYYCEIIVGLLMWGALSDERTGLSFTTAPGPRQRSLVTIFYCVRFETSFFVASYDSWGYSGGIRPRLHTGDTHIYKSGLSCSLGAEQLENSASNSYPLLRAHVA